MSGDAVVIAADPLLWSFASLSHADLCLLDLGFSAGMPKPVQRLAKSQISGAGLSNAGLLAFIPVFAIYYTLLILPFFPGGGTRVENILFWPSFAAFTMVFIFRNWSLIEKSFVRSSPIMSLVAYLVFAAASVTWAYNPALAFSRIVVQILFIFVIVAPYALPISTKYTIASAHLCYAMALVVSAAYVLTTPPSPIGHPGYFTHKQELGLLAAVSIILSSHEVLYSGWRRLGAIIALGLGFWLIFASESKSALAYAFIAMAMSYVILLICKATRLTPAYIIAAIVILSKFVNNPIERIGYRLYGDSTLTGRTGIWAFAEHQISRKPWFGWGFHSYFFVPNSPQLEAPGYVGQMPSSHSGFLELRLETGWIGYWLFMLFIYTSLHLIERVRCKDPVLAWCYLSIELFALLINQTDSNWLDLDPLWIIYLFVVAETVRFSLSSKIPHLKKVPVKRTSLQTLHVGPPRVGAVRSRPFIRS